MRLQPQTKQQQNAERVVQMTELIKGENKAKKKKREEEKKTKLKKRNKKKPQ